jgi:hypothetical protein
MKHWNLNRLSISNKQTAKHLKNTISKRVIHYFHLDRIQRKYIQTRMVASREGLQDFVLECFCYRPIP